MKEIWKDIIGYESKYQVSNLGNIKNIKTGRIRKLKNNSGYLEVNLFKNSKEKFYKVHRLVAIHFIPNPSNLPCVCHKDETLNDKGVMDCSIENLFWGTMKDNMQDMIHKGRGNNHFITNHPHKGKFGKENHRSKKVIQYDISMNFIKIWDSGVDVFRTLGIQSQNVGRCCKGNTKTAGGFIWKFNI